MQGDDICNRLEKLNELEETRHEQVVRAIERLGEAQQDLPRMLNINAPTQVCRAVVQLGAIAGAAYVWQQTPGLIGGLAGAGILAFAFFVTDLSNYKSSNKN